MQGTGQEGTGNENENPGSLGLEGTGNKGLQVPGKEGIGDTIPRATTRTNSQQHLTLFLNFFFNLQGHLELAFPQSSFPCSPWPWITEIYIK